MNPVVRTAAAALLLACCVPVAVAQIYPSKPVRIIVGFTPGGPGDIAVRGASQVLQQAMGQPFVLDNRVGADGIIAGEACVRSSPDGYTLCAGDSYMYALNPVIRAKMSYDPARDMAPVVHLGYLPAAIWVNASVAAKSLGELFEMVRAKPKTISWGSFGLASASHLYIEWLKNEKNIVFLNVPYKSASQAFKAVVAGEVQVAVFGSGLAMPLAKAGKIRGLAINTDKRLSGLPDVPTFREAGMDIPIIMVRFDGAGRNAQGHPAARHAEVGKGLMAVPPRGHNFWTAGIVAEPPAVIPERSWRCCSASARYAALVKAAGVTVEQLAAAGQPIGVIFCGTDVDRSAGVSMMQLAGLVRRCRKMLDSDFGTTSSPRMNQQ
jgi:tripartite-type tricarboxylate transporter receptor subunit TctC